MIPLKGCTTCKNGKGVLNMQSRYMVALLKQDANPFLFEIPKIHEVRANLRGIFQQHAWEKGKE